MEADIIQLRNNVHHVRNPTEVEQVTGYSSRSTSGRGQLKPVDLRLALHRNRLKFEQTRFHLGFLYGNLWPCEIDHPKVYSTKCCETFTLSEHTDVSWRKDGGEQRNELSSLPLTFCGPTKNLSKDKPYVK